MEEVTVVEHFVNREHDFPRHSGSASVLSKNKTLAPISARFAGPGPGAHDHHPMVGFIDHDCTKWREPNYAMRSRKPEMKYDTVGPGPAITVPMLFTHDGKYNPPKYSMRRVCHPPKPFNNPGPPTYKAELVPPTQEARAPKYSMRARCRYPPGDVVPAPNTYSVPPVMGRGQPWFPEDPGCTAVMVRDEYYSFMKDLARTPGPAAHNVGHPDAPE